MVVTHILIDVRFVQLQSYKTLVSSEVLKASEVWKINRKP